MKKFILFTFLYLSTLIAFGQNQIRVRAGILSTNTTVSEYNRGLDFFYYDSVTLYSRVTAPQVNVDIDIDLGKNFFFSTGLGYSEKGLEGIHYNNGDYWYDAKQKYMGSNFLLKYHYKFNDEKFGVFAAAGFRADFAVGGPNNAEIATVAGAEYFNAFGTFNVAEFSFSTIVGVSYKLGAGDLTIDANFLNGLSDTMVDPFIVGRTFSIGATVGYSIYF